MFAKPWDKQGMLLIQTEYIITTSSCQRRGNMLHSISQIYDSQRYSDCQKSWHNPILAKTNLWGTLQMATMWKKAEQQFRTIPMHNRKQFQEWNFSLACGCSINSHHQRAQCGSQGDWQSLWLSKTSEQFPSQVANMTTTKGDILTLLCSLDNKMMNEVGPCNPSQPGGIPLQDFFGPNSDWTNTTKTQLASCSSLLWTLSEAWQQVYACTLYKHSWCWSVHIRKIVALKRSLVKVCYKGSLAFLYQNTTLLDTFCKVDMHTHTQIW